MKTFKLFLISLLTVCALNVWAVPQAVQAEVAAQPMIHQGTCHWRKKDVMCQIFYNKAAETMYLVVFTNDTKAITHVVKVKDKVETLLYTNSKFVT